MIIALLNVGGIGKFNPAFRARGHKIRQVPDEIGKTEVGLCAGNRHVAKGGLRGLELALEPERRQHFAAPVGVCVGPGG